MLSFFPPVVIDVDVIKFENNREFWTCQCRDLPGKEAGSKFDGFLIVCGDVDIRDILGTEAEPARDDAFTSKFVAPNHVVVSVPASNHGEHGHDSEDTNEFIDEENIHTTLNDAINKFNSDLLRKKNVKTFYLQFPSDVCLSLEKLKRGNKNGEMDCELLPAEVDLPDLQENPLEKIKVVVNQSVEEAFKHVKFSKPALMWTIAIDEEGRDGDLKKKSPLSKGKAAMLAAKKKRGNKN